MSRGLGDVYKRQQYAMVVAAVCIVGYLIAGIVKIWWAALGSSLLILFAVLTVLKRREQKKDAEEQHA